MADTEQQQQLGDVTFYKSLKSNSLKVIKNNKYLHGTLASFRMTSVTYLHLFTGVEKSCVKVSRHYIYNTLYLTVQ